MKKVETAGKIFITVILLSLFIKLFILDFMIVSGTSMVPALQPGTVVVEYKLAWGIPVPFRNQYLVRWGKPDAGDLILYPWLDRIVVKRCIATEGTKLVFSSEKGYSVTIGKTLIPLDEAQFRKLKYADKVPDGMIFALGDNMSVSRDSREYGFVSLDSIRGKVLWK